MLVATICVVMDFLMVSQVVTVLESLLAIPALKSGPDAALEAQMPRQVTLVRVSAAAFRTKKWWPVLRILHSLPNCNIRRKG